MAVGNGSLTPDGGVNQQLLAYLRKMQGKRLGIVMFDCKCGIFLTIATLADFFCLVYTEPSDLLPVFLGLRPPPA